MYHSPIQVNGLSLLFPQKVCFEDFTATVECGTRIAVIGRNGSGKSTLLKILHGAFEPSSGSVKIPPNVVCGYVPQVAEKFDACSGSQRFQRALTEALSRDPNLLLLDEPTNHLDGDNRRSLMRMLQSYGGTLIVVSHDAELLRSCVRTLWHVDGGKIKIFTGTYDDYIREIGMQRLAVEEKLAQLERQKMEMHGALMREQRRAAKSKSIGEKNVKRRKWLPVVAHDKANGAEKAAGKKRVAIDLKKRKFAESLANLQLPEVILPKFSLPAAGSGNHTILSIVGGSVGRRSAPILLAGINFSLRFGERMAILGKNGSGKSTLAGAILCDPDIVKSGNWSVPRSGDIGYLDQHYGTLRAEDSAFAAIAEVAPQLSHGEVRKHLAAFLFRKNEEVECQISQLSGGEKARLSLARIAAKPPKLLILDEITNNLDLETREHVIQILKNFRGAMIVISHDGDFLERVGVCSGYRVGEN
ncbi:MAG: ATP-binding cassette domain-containing protein [Puniceicoccales bacterium]|jgi:ATPase subunit of ABC transporter with duplicated ATPase domains|nr:ATP-binding cassette domain-containing protein [Puniceicoccales bacterium]